MYLALFTARQWARKYYPGLKGAEIVAREVHWYGTVFQEDYYLTDMEKGWCYGRPDTAHLLAPRL